MKTYIIALLVATATAMNAADMTGNQTHRHTPRTQTEVTDAATDKADNAAQSGSATVSKAGHSSSQSAPASAQKSSSVSKTSSGTSSKGFSGSSKASSAPDDNDDEGIEAYSDTTEVWDADTVTANSYQVSIDDDSMDDIFSGLSWIGGGMVYTLLILLILFVLSPVAIIAVICYFIYKNRKLKVRQAEIAMQNGQPIPVDSAAPKPVSDNVMWQKGINKIFVGLGLICLFWFMGFDTGIGIGLLVVFCGIGQAVIARTSPGKSASSADSSDGDDTLFDFSIEVERHDKDKPSASDGKPSATDGDASATDNVR